MAANIRMGNIKLVLCFAFYLAWWIVGFNPRHPIRGLRSGWLLIPAVVLGALALFDICRGLEYTGGLVPSMALVAGGAVVYAVLLGVTGRLLHRPVTSELFIIVLWATVALLEANTLVAIGSIPSWLGWVLMLLCLIAAAVSLVCYQLFYGLEAWPAFVDGAIPLLLAGIMTGVIASCAS